MFITLVNVFTPTVGVLISLFLNNPESSIAILSTIFLLAVVLNLCNPPPLVVKSIVPIPDNAFVLDSEI